MIFIMPCAPIPISVRFWKKIKKPEIAEDCWKWTGAKNENGYGVIGAGARGAGVLKAPRVSWTIHNGEIPEGIFVLHRCDNPECCNPLHLFLGNGSDNMKDCSNKGRLKIPHRSGAENNLSKLTQNEVNEIRAVYKNRCRTNGAFPLAKKYGVHWKTILKVAKHKSWKTNDIKTES